IFVGDDEAEGINVELARLGKVSDDDFHVCTAQNIWGLYFSHDDSLGLKKGRGERRRVKLVSLLAEDWVMYFAEVDVNSLLVGVEVNGAVATLMAKTGCLHATEWGTQVTYVIGVQPDHARFHVLCEVVGTLQIRSPDVRSQAVLGVISQLQRFFIGVEWGNCYDRAEDFFLEDACFWVHVNEDSGLDEVALWELFRTLAASNQLGFLLTNLDVGGDLFVVLWVNQCADLGLRIGRQTNHDAFCLRCVALDELVVAAALNQDACTSGATLTVKGADTEDGGIDSCF